MPKFATYTDLLAYHAKGGVPYTNLEFVRLLAASEPAPGTLAHWWFWTGHCEVRRHG